MATVVALMMTVGLLPASAIAATVTPRQNSTTAPTGDYIVTFVQDAFHTQKVGVSTVDENGDPLTITGATLDGKTLQIGGGTMTVADLTSGYGLLNVTASDGQQYYLEDATWGTTGSVIGTFTYADVTKPEYGGQGIFLHYLPANGVRIPAKAWDSTGNAEISGAATSTGIPAGNITNEVAQDFVTGNGGVWYFDRAELRPAAGNAGSNVPIDSIRLENGYYYVTTSLTTGQVAFSESEWEVYLVYQPGVTVTLQVTRNNLANQNNTINGTPVTTLVTGTSDNLVYQVPRGGSQDFVINIGQTSNLTVTDITNGGTGTALFSSAEQGYEQKSYTLSVSGEKNSTVKIDFDDLGSGTNAYFFDFNHKADHPANYHSYNMFLGTSKLDGTPASDSGQNNGYTAVEGDNYKIYINENNELEIRFGRPSNENNSYVPNVLTINGTAIQLPTPGVDYELDRASGTYTLTTDDYPPPTTIYDTAGNVQAVVTFVEGYVNYANNDVGGAMSIFTYQFTQIHNNLKIDFFNLSGTGSNEVSLVSVGSGASMHLYNGSWSNFAVGSVFRDGMNITLYADVDWDSYVERFTLRDNEADLTPEVFDPSAQSGPNNQTSSTAWWGDKAYYFAGGGVNTGNTGKIQGFKQGLLETAPVEFHYALHNKEDTAAYTLSTNFQYANNAVPAEIPDLVISAQEGSFVGWSLYENGGGQIFQAGDTVTWGVINADPNVVNYQTEEGVAYIHLYPVFEDATSGNYAEYTVHVHASQERIFSGTGLVGSVLDRDIVMAMDGVKNYVDSLGSTWVLDGGQSDSILELVQDSSNQFHLYYNSTQPVTLTFVSEHGFTGEADAETQVQREANPNTAMTGVDIPAPNSGGTVGATFLGWNTNADAATGVFTDELKNTVVPSQDTTYYAIYADDITLSFFPWSPTQGWEMADQPTEIAVPAGQSINASSTENAQKVTDLEHDYEAQGYTFLGWYQGGPYGQVNYTTEALLDVTDFSAGTVFYARYQAKTDTTIVLDANGGTFASTAEGTDAVLSENNGTLTVTGKAVGSVYLPPAPTRSDGNVFVGWVPTNDNTSQTGNASLTVAPGQQTYKALWITATLTVEVNDGQNLVYDGTEKTPNLTVKRGDTTLNANDYTVSYSADRTNVGKVFVTVTLKDGSGITGSTTFDIAPRDIGSATVAAIPATQYTGSMITPTVSVTDSVPSANTTLKLGTDYVVSYGDESHDNTSVGASTGIVYVNGIGNYRGSVTQPFQIIYQTGEISVGAIADQTYNPAGAPAGFADDAAAKQTLVVYDQNRRLLELGVDFTYDITPKTGDEVDWSVGTKTITIDGINNYENKSAETTFQVVAATASLTVTVEPAQMVVGGGNPTITVTAAGGGDLAPDEYTLSFMKYDTSALEWVAYSLPEGQETPNEAGMYRITATGAPTSDYAGAKGSHVFVRTAREVTDGGYWVELKSGSQVNPYNGQSYGDALLGAEGSSNLKVMQMSGGSEAEASGVTATITTIQYGSETLYSSSAAGAGANTLEQAKDLMKNAGVYTVTVSLSGSGVTTSTATLTLTITPKSISSSDIQFTPVQQEGTGAYLTGENGTLLFEKEYTGAAHDHSFQLVDQTINSAGQLVGYNEGETVPDGADYYVATHEHDAHYNAGAYTLTIVGTGNYEGTLTKVFTIRPKTINVGQADTGDIQLTYGYTTQEAETALAQLQAAVDSAIVSADKSGGSPDTSKISIELYIDAVDVGEDQDHLHARINGTSANNYRLVIHSRVDVKAYDIGGTHQETGGETNNVTVQVTPESHGYDGNAHIPGITVTDTRNGTVLSPNRDYTVEYYLGEAVEANEKTEMREPGVYTIQITGKTNYTGTVSAAFTITEPLGNEFIVSVQDADNLVYDGGEKTPEVVVSLGSMVLTEVTDENSGTVADGYRVEYHNNVNAGTATVTVTGVGTYSNLSQTRTFEIKPKTLTDDMVALDQSTASFTGQAVVPTVTVTDTVAGVTDTVVSASSGYTVSYQREGVNQPSMVDVGAYTVVIAGRGNYTGTVSKDFEITQASIGEGSTPGTGFTVQIYPSVGVFDNQDHKDRIGVVVAYNGKTLTREADYTVSYRDPQGASTTALRDVGVYTVVITGTGNYSGSATATYEIVSAQGGQSAFEITLSNDSFTYNGQEQRPTVTVQVGEETLAAGTGPDDANPAAGYYVQWPQQPIDAGSYTLVVRGLGNYAGQVATATYSIGQKSIANVTVDAIPAQTYTGGQITPTGLTVADGEISDADRQGLSVNRDYTLIYGDNVNVGASSGSVTLVGTGNYTGEKTVNFPIEALDMNQGGDGTGSTTDPAAGFTVDVYPASAPYTGSEHRPAVVVHYNGQLLTEAENGTGDYTVTYSVDGGTGLGGNGLPQAVGSYTITITGTGNYAGTVTADYQVTSAAGNVLLVEAIPDGTYSGQMQDPTIVVKVVTIGEDGNVSGEAVTLVSGDYEVEWTGNRTDAGMHIATVTATKTEYNGLSATVPFRIHPKNLGDTDVTVTAADTPAPVYNGQAHEPAVTVTISGGPVPSGTQDYVVVYGDNLNAGTATATVYGRGNYTGSKETTFTIEKASGTDDGTGGGTGGSQTSGFRVEVYPGQSPYTGAVHNPHIQIVDVSTGQVLDKSQFDIQITLDAAQATLEQVGTYAITATADASNPNYTGSASASYEITQATSTSGLSVSVSGTTTHTYDGQPWAPTVSVSFNGRPVEATSYQVTYQQLENGSPVGDPSPDRPTDAGSYKVTVTGTDANLSGLVGETQFAITPKTIANVTVADIPDMVLVPGTPSRPENLTVTDPDITVAGTAKELGEDVDYTLSYGANTSAGTGTVILTGTGNYQGSKTVEFTILPAGGDPNDPTLNPSSGTLVIDPIDSVTYNGEKHEPQVTVKWVSNDGQTSIILQEGDYQLEYGENTQVGTGTVTAKGAGNYAGLSAQQTFTIRTKLLHLDVEIHPAQAEMKEVDATDPDITVKLDAETVLSEVSAATEDGYQLSWQKYNADGSLTAAVQASWTDIQTQMGQEGVYLITATGTGIYEGAVGTGTFVRYKADVGTLTPTIPGEGAGEGGLGDGVSVDGNLITLTYDGADHSAALLDKIQISGSSTVTEGTHYTVSVSYNGGPSADVTGDHDKVPMTNAGLYTVTYEPKGDTTTGSSTTVAIIIQPKDISGADVTVTGDLTYNGTAQSPAITVTDGEIADTAKQTLQVGTDFVVSGNSQTNAGKDYPVLIQGTGNYQGVVSGEHTFTIQPATLTISGSDITITYGDPFSIAEGTSDAADEDAGAYTFTVLGRLDPHTEADVAVTLTAPATAEGTHSFTATLSGSQAGNYMVTQPTFTLTVEPLDLTGGAGGGEDGSIGDGESGDGAPEDGQITVTLPGGTLSVTMDPVAMGYTGVAHTPQVTMTYMPTGGQAQILQPGTDYTVTYQADEGSALTDGAMVQVGSYTVLVAGQGNYAGAFRFGYEITANEGDDTDSNGDGYIDDSDEDGVITTGAYRGWLTSDQGYFMAGTSHTPKVNVTFGADGTLLTQDVDFEVTYLDSEGNKVSEIVDVGTYTVRVTGLGKHGSLKFDLAYAVINAPAGGGGGTAPDEGGGIPGVADPDDTGVSEWLETVAHNAYLQGYGNNLFNPDASMTRAEVAQLFYNLLLNKDVPITVSFDDVADTNWYATAVRTLASLGILNGSGDGNFYPNSPITRAEFTAIAMRFSNGNVVGQDIFSDVGPEHWFYEAVLGAVEYGWVVGYGDGIFAPYESIKRSEVTTIVNRMLYRMADEVYVDSHMGELILFTDVTPDRWFFYQVVEATNGHVHSNTEGKETWTGLE